MRNNLAIVYFLITDIKENLFLDIPMLINVWQSHKKIFMFLMNMILWFTDLNKLITLEFVVSLVIILANLKYTIKQIKKLVLYSLIYTPPAISLKRKWFGSLGI
jgi:hypothetical protein